MISTHYSSKYLNHLSIDGWHFSSRNKPGETACETGKIKANAVAIVATTPDNKVVVISEFRKPVGQIVWGFPAGLVDDGESIEEAACREFAEETGMRVIAFERCISNLLSSPGMTDEAVSVAFLRAEGEPSKDSQCGDENIDIHLMDAKQIQELFDSGAAVDVRLGLIYNWLFDKV